MADEILISYRVEIDQLKAELSKVQTQLKQTENAAKTSAKTASKEFNKAGSEIGASLKQIAGAIGIAFGAQQIISFGKESIKAFAEAEVNANKLKFAIKQIGNEGQAAFNKLIEQSSKLQDVSIFSDDSIQKAQTQLATLGLTSDQIESLVPKILDLASATGTDLGQATDMIIQGINGQTRSLKAVGLEFDATGDKTKNLSILTENLNKFQGATAAALETTEGKTRRLENAFDDFKEKIGEALVNELSGYLDFYDVLNGKQTLAGVLLKKSNNSLQDGLNKFNEVTLRLGAQSEDERVKQIKLAEERILALKKQSANAQSIIDYQNISTRVQNELNLIKDLNEINKEGVGLKTEANLDAANKEKELREKQLIELRDLQASLLEDEKNRELAQLINKFTDIRNAHQGQNEYLLALEEKYRQERDAIIEKFDDKEKADNEADFEDAIKLSDSLVDEKAKIDKEDYEKRKALRKKEFDEEQELIKKRRVAFQDSANFAAQNLEAISSISNNILQERLNEVQENSDREKEILDSQLRSGIISRVKYEEEIKKLDEKKRKEEAKLRKQQFENEKDIALIKIAISTAQGIANALEGDSYTASYRVAFAALTGAAQAAIVASQPTPKFAKGVVDLKGSGTKTSDSIHAMLSKGESVITADATATDKALFEAFNKGKGHKYIYENYVMPALQEQINKFSKSKEQSFAQNIANSMMLNSGSFKDANILDSLKMNRRAEKENFEKLIKVINKQNTNIRSIV